MGKGISERQNHVEMVDKYEQQKYLSGIPNNCPLEDRRLEGK